MIYWPNIETRSIYECQKIAAKRGKMNIKSESFGSYKKFLVVTTSFFISYTSKQQIALTCQ